MARRFVRSLNLLLKSARLYALDPPHTGEQLKTAWLELCATLGTEGTFTVSVADARLLLNGVPVEPSPAERTFARLLAQARLTSLQFSPNVSYEDFRQFLEAFGEASHGAERMAGVAE